MKSIVKEKQNFERLEVRKEVLMEMFKVIYQCDFYFNLFINFTVNFQYNPFKLRILNEKVKTPTTTIYRCGPLIDLCRGPHVRHTGKIKAFKVTKVTKTKKNHIEDKLNFLNFLTEFGFLLGGQG